MAMTADEVEKTSPLQTARFIVNIGSEQIACSTITPPNPSRTAVTYRDGRGGIWRAPGLLTDMDFSIGRALISPRSYFWKWHNDSRMNRIRKEDITVNLTDEQGTTVFLSYILTNCFPTGVTAATFDATNAAFYIENINFACDRFDMSFAD